MAQGAEPEKKKKIQFPLMVKSDLNRGMPTMYTVDNSVLFEIAFVISAL